MLKYSLLALFLCGGVMTSAGISPTLSCAPDLETGFARWYLVSGAELTIRRWTDGFRSNEALKQPNSQNKCWHFQQTTERGCVKAQRPVDRDRRRSYFGHPGSFSTKLAGDWHEFSLNLCRVFSHRSCVFIVLLRVHVWVIHRSAVICVIKWSINEDNQFADWHKTNLLTDLWPMFACTDQLTVTVIHRLTDNKDRLTDKDTVELRSAVNGQQRRSLARQWELLTLCYWHYLTLDLAAAWSAPTRPHSGNRLMFYSSCLK